jgi:uncharacterized protein (DUF58 family)
MYALEPQLVESDCLGFTQTSPGSAGGRCSCSTPTSSSRRWPRTLLPALPLAKSHLVLIAASRTPVVAWAWGGTTTEEAVYRKAAAVQALDERRRTAARLRGYGATVIDAPPGALAPQLADAYLRVKATGRL